MEGSSEIVPTRSLIELVSAPVHVHVGQRFLVVMATDENFISDTMVRREEHIDLDGPIEGENRNGSHRFPNLVATQAGNLRITFTAVMYGADIATMEVEVEVRRARPQ